MSRARTSSELPAGAATMNLIGLSGQFWALASRPGQEASARTTVNPANACRHRSSMVLLPVLTSAPSGTGRTGRVDAPAHQVLKQSLLCVQPVFSFFPDHAMRAVDHFRR